MVRKSLYQHLAGSLMIASSLFLTACPATPFNFPPPSEMGGAPFSYPTYGSYAPGYNYGTETSYTPVLSAQANQEYLNSLFSSLWAPDSKLIAIRAVTPSFENLGNGPLDKQQKASGHDQVLIFDPETGVKLASWSLPTEVTRATHFSHYSAKQFAGLQWSADGRQLYVLQPKHSADKLLQSMVLYTLVPNRLEPTVREIFIPSSLKELSTLGFSLPSLSPQGDKVALFRRFRTEAGEQQEAILLNLNTSAIERRIPLSGTPLQEAGWSQDGQSQYIMIESQTNEQPQTAFLRVKDQKSETLFSLPAGSGTFVLSPDRKQVLASFPQGATSPTGQQAEAHLSDPANSQLNLVYDLESSKQQVLFKPPVQAIHASHAKLALGVSHEQLLWDYQDQLNYLSLPESDEPAYGKPNFKWTIINPLQKSLQPGVDIRPSLEQLELNLHPKLDPYSGQPWVYDPATPIVAAFSPKDGRVLLRPGAVNVVTHNPLFQVWNPATQQFRALNATFTDFKGLSDRSN